MNALAGLVWIALVIGTVYGAMWLGRELRMWRPRAVYRVNYESGKILYIGSAFNIKIRMRRHFRQRDTTSAWFYDASIRFQNTLEPDAVRWYRNPVLANAAETEAINREQPPGNIAGTLRARQRRVVVHDD